MHSAVSPVVDYGKQSAGQIFLGEYANSGSNLLGTVGSIAAGFTGLDLPADIRDITHNVQNWESTWSHVGKTGLNVAATLPLVGAFKHVDEVIEVAQGVKRGASGTLDALSGSGASVKLPNGLTRAGHAFDKHAAGQRSASSIFPRLRGNNAAKNATGQGILDDILTDPGTIRGSVTTGNFKGGTRFVAPDGRKAVFDKDSVFQYFGE